ncbi:uncharacterized protein LOC141686779 isoform X3 [Apium graveolens]|uniref:uncharacterized protein LOC141686779 isoform X3 n=1 Tax=Apium graveolens TaxID=4045 RepID=UPI003D7A9E66
MDDQIRGDTIVNEEDVPLGGRGRPPIPVTEEVLECRRLSKQQANASRPKRVGPSRKRGRPKRGMLGTIQGEEDLSSTPINTTCHQYGAATSTQTSPLNSDVSSAKEEGPARERGRPKREVL